MVLRGIMSDDVLIGEKARGQEDNHGCVGDAGEESIGLVSADQKEKI